MADREIRFWFLARGIAPKESLWFPLMLIVEEDQPAIYSAVIAGLEARIVASGPSEYEAAESAIDLFKDIVDNAVEDGTPLNHALGPNVEFKWLPIPIEQAGATLKQLGAMLDEALKQSDDWRQMPASPAFTPLIEAIA